MPVASVNKLTLPPVGRKDMHIRRPRIFMGLIKAALRSISETDFKNNRFSKLAIISVTGVDSVTCIEEVTTKSNLKFSIVRKICLIKKQRIVSERNLPAMGFTAKPSIKKYKNYQTYMRG